MKNRRRALGLFLAFALAAIGVIALVSYVNNTTNDAKAKEAQVQVYVVTKRIPKGADAATIEESVEATDVPARVKPADAVTDTNAIGTKVTGSELLPGDFLLSSRLAAKSSVRQDVPPNMVQVAVKLAPERAVGGAIKPDDTVGVYLSFDPFDIDASGRASSGGTATTTNAPNKTPNTTRLEFQKVLVTDVQVADEQTKSVDGKDQAVLSSSTNYLVTLALTPEQSERLVFASEFGHVWLSNEPATVSDDGTRLVTLGNVYKVVK
jgi:pilus assembly protein CpaB